MIEKLRQINKKLIKLNLNNAEELKKQQIIEKILLDEKCFFKMSIEHAYSILRDLGVKESALKDTYEILIDSKKFN